MNPSSAGHSTSSKNLKGGELLGFLEVLPSVSVHGKAAQLPDTENIRGRKNPTVTLEAIAERSLGFWHTFFGMKGCINDKHVVESSSLVERIAFGKYIILCE